jgi:bleomycin hydrolase
MKRKYNDMLFSDESKVESSFEVDKTSVGLSLEFKNKCRDRFLSNPVNMITRNAITSVGSQLTTINQDRLKDVDHIFTYSVKKKNVRATNQGMSGRCWMFSGLNMFRHILINALNLENFEFSETYLYFYDKWERCNSYIQWFIDNPKVDPNDLYFDYMTGVYMSDGGWWNTFSNLIEKYGIVPKSVMGETWQSGDSDDMNVVISEQLNDCVIELTGDVSMSMDNKMSIKNKTLDRIYSTLVKFLGEPPENFDWTFTLDEEEVVSRTVKKLTPYKFKDMVIPKLRLCNYVLLSNIPSKKYNEVYEIENSSNVVGGVNCRLVNVHMDELVKYCIKTIKNGMPVWFACDVSQKFNYYHSALDDKLDDGHRVFGRNRNLSKEKCIIFRNTQANHAMCLTGVNLDKKGIPISWQVENSWSYVDNTIPGLDGWLWMSHSWFKKYVMEVVINRSVLSRNMNKVVDRDSVKLPPYDSMSRMLHVSGMKVPNNYLDILRSRN